MFSKSIKSLVWRGAVGALLGGLVWLLMIPKLHGVGLDWPLIQTGIVLIIPFSIVLGAFIGAIIWKIYVWRRKNVGVIARALAGVGCTIILGAIFGHVISNYKSEGIPWLALLEFGVVVGALSGVVAGSQSRVAKSL
jgi:predicted permease